MKRQKEIIDRIKINAIKQKIQIMRVYEIYKQNKIEKVKNKQKDEKERDNL